MSINDQLSQQVSDNSAQAWKNTWSDAELNSQVTAADKQVSTDSYLAQEADQILAYTKSLPYDEQAIAVARQASDEAHAKLNADIAKSASLKDILSKSEASTKQKNQRLEAILPWTDVDSIFFKRFYIDANRWDKLYPYRLIVIDATTNQVINSNKSKDLETASATFTVSINPSTGSSITSFTPVLNKWIFNLPITPQQLNIADQYAISTSASLRGIVEEHSGVRFKNISCVGTMGVWPYRSDVAPIPTSPTIAQSLFGGTIASAQKVANQFSALINTVTGNHPANKPKILNPTYSTAGNTSTGYYQALALQQFLEQYAEAKKDPKNASWRLVFDIPKQNQSYVVTPTQFVWQQSANKPAEITYTFQLKAWRRVILTDKPTPANPSIQTLKPGVLQRILNSIREARALTSSAIDLIGAVKGDILAPLEALRQVTVFVKELAGLPLAISDLKYEVQRAYHSPIADALADLQRTSNVIEAAGKSITSNYASSSADIIASLKIIKLSKDQSQGLSRDAIAAGQLGKASADLQSIDNVAKIFNSPERHFGLLDLIPKDNVKFSPKQNKEIDAGIQPSTVLTVKNLKDYKAVIQDLAVQLSNNFGTGNSFYSQVYNKPTPNTRVTPITLDEYSLLNSLYSVMQEIDVLTASTEIDDSYKQSNMDYVAGLAADSGVTFNNATSKILRPVPFGSTMEAIAARYLGDPQRWLEIATLNNLRSPYIDENGFTLPLLSNASGRRITVSNISNLYVGQVVILKSSTQPQTARHIAEISRLSDTSYLLSLDGESNLDNFKLIDQAYLQAYLPGTCNSQQKIFIPSDLSLPNDPNILPPLVAANDPFTGISKVDFLLQESGDIALNSFGDFRLAYGMTNLLQALKIKIGSQKGKILLHPEFGIGVKAGMNVADANVQDIYNSINKLVSEDPRFNGISSLQISINGSVLTINMSVDVINKLGVFPVTFDVAL